MMISQGESLNKRRLKRNNEPFKVSDSLKGKQDSSAILHFTLISREGNSFGKKRCKKTKEGRPQRNLVKLVASEAITGPT